MDVDVVPCGDRRGGHRDGKAVLADLVAPSEAPERQLVALWDPGESDPRMATHLPGLAGCETTGTQDHSDVIGRVELEEITHWPS